MREAGQDAASDSDWNEAHRREFVIRPLAAKGAIDGASATEAMTLLGIGRSRLFELVRKEGEALIPR